MGVKHAGGFALLLTASICVPEGVYKVSLTNRDERIKQYIWSVNEASKHDAITKIVLVDNTASEFDEAMVKKHLEMRGCEFEYISFLGDKNRLVNQGKGYGEGEIIAFALSHSAILSDCDFFLKLTGRLAIGNMSSVLRGIDSSKCYLNRYAIRAYDLCDTRFYGMPKQLYDEHFRDLFQSVDDSKGVYIEKLFASKAKEGVINSYCTRECPDIIGVSGSTGEPYDLPRSKFFIRSFLHRIGRMGF